MQQRLDQIEDEFETVKQLLMSAARYAESANERLDRVAEQQQENTRAIARLGERIDALTTAGQRTDQRLDQLAERVDRLAERVDQLTSDVGEMRVTMEASFQQAEQDRSQAAIDRAEFRTTVEQLLRVLTQRFNSNGQGNE